MKTCNGCGLAYDSVDASGRCQGCAAELAAAQPPRQPDPELNAIRNQLQQQDQKFNQLAQSLQRQAQPQQQQADPNDVNRQIWQNPAAAIDHIATQRANQMAAAVMAETQDMAVENAKRIARGDNPDDQADFDRLLPEITQRVASNPIAYQRSPVLWRNMLNVIRGEKFHELRRDQNEAATAGTPRPPAIRINDGPASPSVRAGTAARKTELEPMAKEVARKLKISDDEMRFGMEAFANQGDEKDPSKPSSWDKYMTFDKKTGPAYHKKLAAAGSRA